MTDADSPRPAATADAMTWTAEPPDRHAAKMLAAIQAGERWAGQQIAVTVATGIFFWPALFFIILVATNSRPGWWEWLGAVLCPALFIAGIAVAVRMTIAHHRAR